MKGSMDPRGDLGPGVLNFKKTKSRVFEMKSVRIDMTIVCRSCSSLLINDPKSTYF